MSSKLTKFEIGKSYFINGIGSNNYTLYITIVSISSNRKTIVLKNMNDNFNHVKSYKVKMYKSKIYGDIEYLSIGNHSFDPILLAKNEYKQ